ncbi:hypothetical protein [Bacillus infantis]|uniref:hypothetical protein n=1 Tax=Bacillus infantis TaxID=324767 RepID=UPI003CEBA0CA
MKKVLDFQKAVEQKQNKKEKHNLSREMNTKEITSEIIGIIEEGYKEVIDSYKDTLDSNIRNFDKLYNMHTKLQEECNSLISTLERVADVSDKYSYFSLLAEHFIVKNDLEEEFIEFIKNVAENETEEDYRNAAQWKDDDYRTEMENGDMVEMILDEYGMYKEDKYHLFDDNEDMEEAN